MSEEVVLINPFRVPTDKLEEAIKYWEAHRDFMQEQTGYISTKLHQTIQGGGLRGEPVTFELINVAVWASREAFFNAAQKMRTELSDIPQVEGLIGDPALYQIIRE